METKIVKDWGKKIQKIMKWRKAFHKSKNDELRNLIIEKMDKIKYGEDKKMKKTRRICA